MANERLFGIRHQIALDRLKYSAKPDDNWGIDGSIGNFDPYHSYDKTFQNLFPRGSYSFSSLLVKDRKKGRTANVLDLFGGGYFINDFSLVDNMFAVRFQERDHILLTRLMDKQANAPFREADKLGPEIVFQRAVATWQDRTKIAGNLYFPKSWTEIKRKQAEKGVKDFNLIVCRPIGPFSAEAILGNRTQVLTEEELGVYLYIYTDMLENSLRLCSPDHGRIFTEVPRIGIPDDLLQSFADNLNEVKGLKVKLAQRGDLEPGGKVLRFTKTADLPKEVIMGLNTCSKLGS